MTFSRSEWAVNFIFGLGSPWIKSPGGSACLTRARPWQQTRLPGYDSLAAGLKKKCFRQFQKDLHILTWPLFFCLCKLLLNIFFKKTFHYTILWRNLHNLWTWCKSNPNDYWENTLECQSCVHPENVNVCVFSSFVQNYLIPAPGTK